MSASDERRSHGRSPWREAFEMLARRPVGADASVNLKRNSKGAVEIDVLARGETATGASNGAQIEFDALCAKYPYPVEGAVSPPEPPWPLVGVSSTKLIGGARP
jgi:hypothetical protein